MVSFCTMCHGVQDITKAVGGDDDCLALLLGAHYVRASAPHWAGKDLAKVKSKANDLLTTHVFKVSSRGRNTRLQHLPLMDDFWEAAACIVSAPCVVAWACLC